MQIDTTRFGALDIDEGAVLTFPEGLPGFEGCRRFVFVPHGGSGPFEWLQSVENGTLAFLAMRPHQIFPDYAPRVPAAELEALGLDKGAHGPRLYTLLTVPQGDPRGITANLLAPILVNPASRYARQVIVNNDEYGLRHRLLPENMA
ncbi:MAG: flagellar assembly protein FliW [Armatimonadetes bacterium]|nr:flagellar assembly protein FliW [Armatimonadota bacterium]